MTYQPPSSPFPRSSQAEKKGIVPMWLWGAECCWKSHGGTRKLGIWGTQKKNASIFVKRFLWMQTHKNNVYHVNVNSWTIVSSVWFSNACSFNHWLLCSFVFFWGGFEVMKLWPRELTRAQVTKSRPSTWEMPCHTRIPQGPEGAEIDLKLY